MSLRFYVYISDAKVDMLLPQVDAGFTRRRTTEVGVSFKFFTVKRSAESPEAHRIARLERVLEYLDDFGDVGTVDDPGQYVRGRLPMRWGPLPSAQTSAQPVTAASAQASLVYFGGSTERTIIGLGGTSGHVLGAGPVASAEQDQAFAPSTMPGLVGVLAAATAGNGEAVPPGALAVVRTANGLMRGAAQEVEFFAKRLLHGPSPYPELDGGKTVLLASPLFVALAD
ncbi:hypothetical protein Shyhy01_17620 [Streptomyces hygroscopicus subsp. hygroscopicus]|uniref:DUF7019 family protein n=1 Tax=Streptomyces sp. KHY 26 TaxID=3097359 RepID=UPI0024A3638A|nr:SAVMC3_10250 family protein [Streptomyces hygroscopicus]GLX48812.1 hypothetical protein Shyhy01_17620 [Streptomyces hygroscopicus subsp. hygroscopicus]